MSSKENSVKECLVKYKKKTLIFDNHERITKEKDQLFCPKIVLIA